MLCLGAVLDTVLAFWIAVCVRGIFYGFGKFWKWSGVVLRLMASRFTRDKVQTAYLPNYQSTLIYWDFFFFFLLKNVELYDVSEFCLSREFGIYEKTILSFFVHFMLSFSFSFF